MSGCLACLALPVILFLARLSRVNQTSRAPQARERLTGLLVEFASGADRSAAKVRQIEALLVALLASDRRYEQLLSAVASFQPGGHPPFHDEQWLAEAFRAYLARRRVPVTEATPGAVWPPPPGQTVQHALHLTRHGAVSSSWRACRRFSLLLAQVSLAVRLQTRAYPWISAMEILYETVYVVDDWYDGPREGFANYQGEPHFYRSLFLDIASDDDYDPDEDRFELTPVPGRIVEWAVESHQLWQKWNEAYRAGTLPKEATDGMRILPEDQAHYAQLCDRVRGYMSTQSAPYIIVRGKFELGCRRVHWTALDQPIPVAT